jgi:uncharacterized membrane protein
MILYGITMNRSAIVLVALFLCMSCSVAAASPAEHDLIIVRDDIPIEYLIGLPYASAHDIPLLQVSGDMLDASEQKQLAGYYQNGARRVLILGGVDTAISDAVEATIREIGYEVERKSGLARENTAALFAIETWKESPYAVVLNGSMEESYLVGLQSAMQLSCPILLTNDTTLTYDTSRALEALGCETVYVIGSTIEQGVFDELDAMGIDYVHIGENIDPHEVIEQPGDGTDLLSPASFVLGTLIGVVAMYAFIRYRSTHQTPEVPLFVLTEDERMVVNAIVRAGGELRQDELPELTNYSRPKVSRIVNDLEGKQILMREKKGKTYKVSIAKKFISRK